MLVTHVYSPDCYVAGAGTVELPLHRNPKPVAAQKAINKLTGLTGIDGAAIVIVPGLTTLESTL